MSNVLIVVKSLVDHKNLKGQCGNGKEKDKEKDKEMAKLQKLCEEKEKELEVLREQSSELVALEKLYFSKLLIFVMLQLQM